MRIRLLIALCCIGFLAFPICVQPSLAKASSRPNPAAPVIVSTITRQDVPKITHSVGTVLASATVQIKSLVEGRVLESPFQEGQLVKKGDVLFKIDPLPFEADLARAKAILQRDIAQLRKAQQELKRQENLRKRRVSSAQTYETAKAEALAQAATVASDKADVQQAELKLGYTIIKAPLSGKTGAILVHPGNIVEAKANAPMVTISAISKVRVALNLPQKLLPQLQKSMENGGAKIKVSIPGDKEKPLLGQMDFIANEVKQSSGTIEIRATVDNPDYRLLPGQFVTAELVLQTYKNAIAIPFDAVSISQKGTYVYIVNPDNSVSLRYVKVLHSDQNISVIADGPIETGERVVIDGQLRLAEGMKVKIITKQTKGNQR